ncbi:hypothetical protein ALT785_240247 [Alteromonas infernus]
MINFTRGGLTAMLNYDNSNNSMNKLGLPYDKAFAVIPIFYFAASICTKRFSLNSLRGNYRVRGHRGWRYNPMGVHWWVHQ